MKFFFKSIQSTLLYNLISFDFILVEISGNKISNFFLSKFFLSKLLSFICLILFDVLKSFKIFIRILSFLARRTAIFYLKHNTLTQKNVSRYKNLRLKLRSTILKNKNNRNRKRLLSSMHSVNNLYRYSKKKKIKQLRENEFASSLSFWSPYDETSLVIKYVLTFLKKKRPLITNFLTILPTLSNSSNEMPFLIILNRKLNLKECSSLFFRNYYLIQLFNSLLNTSSLSFYKIYADLQESKKIVFISFLIKEIF